jgi:hypothetical protein
MSARGPQISDFVLDLIQGGTTEEIGQQVSAELQPPAETPPVETPGSQISAFVHGVIDEFVPPGPLEAPPGGTDLVGVNTFIHHPDWLV